MAVQQRLGLGFGSHGIPDPRVTAEETIARPRQQSHGALPDSSSEHDRGRQVEERREAGVG